MKYLLIAVLGLVFSANACAQDKNFEFQDVCGDPRMESMAWISLTGTAVEIVDGGTLVLKRANGRAQTVKLVAVETGADDAAAKEFLTKTVLGREIEVSVNPGRANDEKIDGEVRLKEREINREMIERGLAGFREPAPYSFSNYAACVYRQLEEKAKAAKLGIWAK